MAEISDLALQRIRQDLEQDRFKPGELAFVLSVAEDKRARLDGRTMPAGSVAIQINVSASDERRALLGDLLEAKTMESLGAIEKTNTGEISPGRGQIPESAPNPPEIEEFE